VIFLAALLTLFYIALFGGQYWRLSSGTHSLASVLPLEGHSPLLSGFGILLFFVSILFDFQIRSFAIFFLADLRL
jgi:hypothetical protein